MTRLYAGTEEALLYVGLAVVHLGSAIDRAGHAAAGMTVATVGCAVILAGREIGHKARAKVRYS